MKRGLRDRLFPAQILGAYQPQNQAPASARASPSHPPGKALKAGVRPASPGPWSPQPLLPRYRPQAHAAPTPRRRPLPQRPSPRHPGGDPPSPTRPPPQDPPSSSRRAAARQHLHRLVGRDEGQHEVEAGPAGGGQQGPAAAEGKRGP